MSQPAEQFAPKCPKCGHSQHYGERCGVRDSECSSICTCEEERRRGERRQGREQHTYVDGPEYSYGDNNETWRRDRRTGNDECDRRAKRGE